VRMKKLNYGLVRARVFHREVANVASGMTKFASRASRQRPSDSLRRIPSRRVARVRTSGMVDAGCSFRGSFRLNNERRYHDWKRPDGKDEAVPMREPHYGPLVCGGVLSCLEVFFILRGCNTRQGSTNANGSYDEPLHGLLG
jgi:hypothetical protein